ncbi:gluconate 2-dehydrogenase subunit 3 family protein [Paraglaciecola chathamensis]|uniref:Twin-arginine translocation pathway signal n=1 Tax=Paraglaciecola chathamensis S18K6 TaxID=1127672 RepID=A0AAV3V7E9_9ALTE|nr:gluconate 2-dehydrogenase subunit 3 family protein [Paraglaciecola chathamensis]GAC12602.1 hypothetical protein GCHA_4685 [Paraglaciecola chathamensis S18K6]
MIDNDCFWLVFIGSINVIKFPESKEEEGNVEINRRIFLGAMLYVVSASVLPSELKKVLKLNVFKSDAAFFNADQMTLVYDLANIMIPTTNTPGASDSHTAQVLDELMVSWASSSTQRQFTNFLAQFQSKAKGANNSNYFSLTKKEREAFVEYVDGNAFEKDRNEFSTAYKRIKALIFHIHYSSEEANPNFFLVPGGYKGNLTESELSAIHKRKYL